MALAVISSQLLLEFKRLPNTQHFIKQTELTFLSICYWIVCFLCVYYVVPCFWPPQLVALSVWALPSHTAAPGYDISASMLNIATEREVSQAPENMEKQANNTHTHAIQKGFNRIYHNSDSASPQKDDRGAKMTCTPVLCPLQLDQVQRNAIQRPALHPISPFPKGQ